MVDRSADRSEDKSTDTTEDKSANKSEDTSEDKSTIKQKSTIGEEDAVHNIEGQKSTIGAANYARWGMALERSRLVLDRVGDKGNAHKSVGTSTFKIPMGRMGPKPKATVKPNPKSTNKIPMGRMGRVPRNLKAK